MSRIGKEPVAIPSGVDVTLDGRTLTVKGPKGTLTQQVHPDVTIEVTGVTDGYRRELEIVGVGYRAAARGSGLTIQVGFSHPVEVDAPEGIALEVASPTRIAVSGSDKQLVGQVAANIRAIRKPEPYKGKGIRYAGEQVRRKAGKAAGS